MRRLRDDSPFTALLMQNTFSPYNLLEIKNQFSPFDKLRMAQGLSDLQRYMIHPGS